MDLQLSESSGVPGVPLRVDRTASGGRLSVHRNGPSREPSEVGSGDRDSGPRTPGPMGMGTELDLVRRSMGMRQAMTMTFTEFEPNRRFGFHGDSKQVDVDVAMTIAPDGETASKLTMSVHAEPKGVAKLMGPMISSQMRKQVTKALGRIKESLETHP
jgi:polyketide cyclase/dehydrase/lipid transport protein